MRERLLSILLAVVSFFILLSSFFLCAAVIIPRDAASGFIAVEIINDDLPELNESFSILLQSVELTEDINGGRDFTFDRDPSLIDMPPSLGTNTRIEVTILQNDNPFGVISLTNTIFRVNEGETAAISLVRSEGTFGSVSVQYTIVNGQAIVGRDYNLPQGSPTVVFAAGQSTASILIPIIDDSDPELQEDFTVQVSLTAGSAASLGTVTAASVVIEASDSPFGEVGFSQAAVDGIQVSNPTVAQGPMGVSLNVIRSAGLNGVTQVRVVLRTMWNNALTLLHILTPSLSSSVPPSPSLSSSLPPSLLPFLPLFLSSLSVDMVSNRS